MYVLCTKPGVQRTSTQACERGACVHACMHACVFMCLQAFKAYFTSRQVG